MLQTPFATLLRPAANMSFPRWLRRRAFLYVPGDDPKKLAKMLAPDVDVDCIVMDCEDGVAPLKKSQARNNIKDTLGKGKPQKRREYDLAVRINSLDTDFAKEDLEVILSNKHSPNTIVLPKVRDGNDLKLFSEYFNKYNKHQCRVELIIGVESALGVINLREICSTAEELGGTSKLTPVGLFFGSDDFCASIGASRSDSNLEVLYARQKLLVTAKAFNLQAIDMVYIAYKDLDGLKRQAVEGASLGFTGKQIIHPDQIKIVQMAFFPNKAEVEWAAGLLKAFHQHERSGKGAFTYHGNMIDRPTMRQAQNIMDLVGAEAEEKPPKV